MSIVTMNMSSFEIERNNSAVYGNEVTCADWHPALTLQSGIENRKAVSMPPDLVAIDMNAFLKKMHAYPQ
ncbi:MAG: hypothetical protein WC208_12770 [Gallionella sp.]|jgi:hypothetical protein